MAVKNNRRTQMTRRLLKTALVELMGEKPFAQITIKDICEQADLNRTTFYLHYMDQSALLRDIEDEVQEKTLDYLRNVKPAADAPGMIEAFLRYIQEQASLFKILLLDEGAEDFRRRFLENSLEGFRENIPVVDDSRIKPYVLCFLMEGSVHMIMSWLERGFDLAPDELASLIFELCNRVAP